MGTYVNAIDDDVWYDATGRITRGYSAYRNGISFGQNVDTYYGSMGAVFRAHNATQTLHGGVVKEKFRTDAIGNRIANRHTNLRMDPNHPDSLGIRVNTYNPAGQLTEVNDSLNNANVFKYEKLVHYDASGGMSYTTTREGSNYWGYLWDATYNFYDAADRLRVFNRHIGALSVSTDSVAGRRGVFEEYFYDALGRRVMVRSQRGSNCSTALSECHSYLERTVWDGDQVFKEIRAKGSSSATATEMENDAGVYTSYEAYPLGQVRYVHAGILDQPIAVIRTGLTSSTPITVYPHQNWRGSFELGTKSDGTLLSTGSGYPTIGWPGAKGKLDGEPSNPVDVAWFGALISDKADGSGMKYMRNRYYDPSTGRFTQQDPIGLAGGMNLYGFAGGDPVTYSDPFGLCPECKEGDDGVRVREGFWNRLRHGIYENCSADSNSDCTPSPVIAEVPSFIGGPGSLIKAVGGLRGAAAAAAKAADSVDDFTIPAKHLAGAGGRWAKFGADVDAHGAIRDALRSSGALFRANNVEGAFRVEAQLGRIIGTKGETGIRVIVGNDGRIWTAFPIK